MIIGVDIGTTFTKASAIFHDGRDGATVSVPSKLVRLPDGAVEQDLEDVIGTVVDVVRSIAASATEPIEAVAITGQGDGLWLRDADGNAVRPPISWMDARAAPIVDEWNDGGDDSITRQIYRLTGSGIFPGSHAALLAWLDANEPESLERAAVAGYCADSVVQRLTGDITVDASDASLPFLDVSSREYSIAALTLAGVQRWRHLLAEPAQAGAVFSLSSRGADLLGLPVGTPITAGPYDLQACGFGCGTTQIGEGTLVVGTTLSCQVLTAEARIDPTAEPAGMWLCTPDSAVYLRVMPSMVGTASIDWLLSIMGLTASSLDELLMDSQPGANGVKALSFFSPSGERAPFVDPRARGEFIGVHLGSRRADLVRALCESLAFAARHCFEVMGLDGDISACGGGMKSRALAQIFCDVLGKPLFIPDTEAVGARGAAMVAWNALGNPVDEDLWRSQRRQISPDPSRTDYYEGAYRRYLSQLADARTRWSLTS